jgi:hypothetical protein
LIFGGKLFPSFWRPTQLPNGKPIIGVPLLSSTSGGISCEPANSSQNCDCKSDVGWDWCGWRSGRILKVCKRAGHNGRLPGSSNLNPRSSNTSDYHVWRRVMARHHDHAGQCDNYSQRGERVQVHTNARKRWRHTKPPLTLATMRTSTRLLTLSMRCLTRTGMTK